MKTTTTGNNRTNPRDHPNFGPGATATCGSSPSAPTGA